MRRLAPLLLLILLASCGAQSQLASRAAQYYSYMAGYNQKPRYSSFLSPAYRSTMDRASLKAYDAAIKTAATEKSRYPRASTRDVALRIQGRFALTTANPQLGDVYRNQGVTKWVKAGMSWYLYLGSDAEVKAYGPFPIGVLPPKYTAPH